MALHLYARLKAPTIEEAIVESVSQAQGAFSFVLLTRDKLIAVRDPHGFRPLALGRLGDAIVVCSETCAMDLIGATYVRDVEPGEVLVISEQGVRSIKPFAPALLAICIFEHVYFARPDSYVLQKASTRCETNLGTLNLLALEHPINADVVVPVPDSGVRAAMGYAEESGVPLRMGLIRNHYVGRTFIEPQPAIRHFGVRVKLNPVKDAFSTASGHRHRRFDRARHHQPEDRQDGAGRGRHGGACAHQFSADYLPLLLRHRHPEPNGTDCRVPHDRRDHDVSGRGQRGLFEPRGVVECRRLGPRLRPVRPAIPAGTRSNSPETRRVTCSWR